MTALMKKPVVRQLFHQGSVEEVKKFLYDTPTFGINHVFNNEGLPALYLACEYDRVDLISLILAHPQIDVNQKNIDGVTPFLVCCHRNQLEIVKLLLKDSRVDINMTDDYNHTPLWYASSSGCLDVFKWVIALRSEIDLDKKAVLNGVQLSPIEVAINEDKKEIVALLERFTENQSKNKI